MQKAAEIGTRRITLEFSHQLYAHRRQDLGKCRHFEFAHCEAKSTIYIKYGKFITFTFTFSPSSVLVSQKICDQLYSSFQSVSIKGKHLPADQMEFCQIAFQPPNKQTLFGNFSPIFCQFFETAVLTKGIYILTMTIVKHLTLFLDSILMDIMVVIGEI